MNKKILKFYGTWCSPCKVLSNMLEGFDAYEIEPIDIDEADEKFLEKFGIRGVPVVAVVNVEEDGSYTLLDKRSGFISKEDLKTFADGL